MLIFGGYAYHHNSNRAFFELNIGMYQRPTRCISIQAGDLDLKFVSKPMSTKIINIQNKREVVFAVDSCISSKNGMTPADV